MNVRHLLLINIIALSSVCSAKVNLRGKVVNADSQPIEYVTVRIDGTSLGAMTNEKGEYRLSCDDRDTINVIFSCIGYKELRRQLINAEGDVRLNVRLSRNPKQLTEVQLLEQKKRTGTMESVDIAAVRNSPDVSGGSVESLLTTLAGVHSSNELSSKYSVRGGSYDENSVYINGVEVYRPMLISSGTQEGLSIINPDMVKRVEFSTGGFPAQYSDKMSSVVDITYRRPEAFEGSASLSLLGGSLSLGQRSGGFSQLHGLRYKRNNSLLNTLETKGEYDPTFFDYQTNLNLTINSKWHAAFLGNVSINNYKFTPTDRTTNFGTIDNARRFTVYFDGNEKDRFATWFGAITIDYHHPKNSAYTLLLSGYRAHERVNYDIAGEYWIQQIGADDGVDSDLTPGVGRYHEHARNRLNASVITAALRGETRTGRLNLFYGVDYTREMIDEYSREWEMQDSAGYMRPDMQYSLFSSQAIDVNRVTAFLQNSGQMRVSSGLFTMNLGVRAAYSDFNNELIVGPRVNLGYLPEKVSNWAFRFATGLYYQSPFYKEYRAMKLDNGTYIVTLNRDLKSQQSIQFIAGSDYTFRALGRPFKLSMEAYYKILSRINSYEIDNLRIIYAGNNDAHGFATGLDFKLFGEFVPGSDSWISFSLMKTQETINGVNVPRPNDQRYSIGLYFTDYFPRLPKLKLNLRGIFADGLPMTVPHTTRADGYFRTPPYKRVDIGVAYAIIGGQSDNLSAKGIKSLWFGVDCFNLFDISNVGSYRWVTDVNSVSYAVPNYLTRRQLNLRLTLDF